MDALFCLFNFETKLYPASFQAIHEGHPILDRLQARESHQPFLFGLLPGSRAQEINRHLPIFLKVAKNIVQSHPESRFICATPERPLNLPEHVEWRAGGTAALKKCQAVLCKSGTCTLELALLNIPMVVAHRIHPVSYALVRYLVKTNLFALPNILHGSMVYPEHIQQLQCEHLSQDLLSVTEHPLNLSALGKPGSAKRIAARIQEIIHA
jgi:lipid-A-disaccharide synthase